MSLAGLALSTLLAAAAPDHAGHDTFTWCVAEGKDARGEVRYFSDPFEGPADKWIEMSFQEYLQRHFLKGAAGFAVSCRTFEGRAATDEALQQAKVPRAGTRDVMTAWRDHFE